MIMLYYHEFMGVPEPMEAEDVRSSFLATTVHLQEDLELSSRDHDAAQAVSDGLRDAKAANTRRVYQTSWHLFCEWTLVTGRQSIPAEPQTVALYLGHLAAEGKAIATIAQARAAISHAHAAQGIPKGDNPARHPAVAEVLKGWRNQAPAPKQADALTTDALARIRETARLPRPGRGGRMESAAVAQARGAIDLAIVGVMADGGLRRSEAAALTWNDVEFWPDGTARITIQKGKNQPEPATVAVTETHRPRPARNSAGWRRTPCRPCSGVQPDRRDAGQPDTCRSKSCRPGRRLLRAQRPDRHGPEDGGRRGAHRCGPEPRPMEARRHGRPLHPGRGRRRGAEVADLNQSQGEMRI